MRILGIDYGTKRVGVAIGDMEAKVAVPFAVVDSSQTTVRSIGKIVEDESVGLIVVGLPIRMEGGQSETQKKVEQFIKELRVAVQVKVETQDERFTTAQVERVTKGYGKAKKGVDKDAAAAALILQSFLERLEK